MRNMKKKTSKNIIYVCSQLNINPQRHIHGISSYQAAFSDCYSQNCSEKLELKSIIDLII